MHNNRPISYVLAAVTEAENDKERIKILREGQTRALLAVLKGAFDKKIVFNTKVPSYKMTPDPNGFAASKIHLEYELFYLFVEGQSHVKDPKKREDILAKLLESIDAGDALAVERMLRKDLSAYRLTRDLVREAFPDLIP